MMLRQAVSAIIDRRWLGLVAAWAMLVPVCVPAHADPVPLTAAIAWQGEAEAPVTLLIASDFQCPFCKRLGPTIAKLRQTFGAQLRVGFVHLPLPFHPQAQPAALAAMAAEKQGKFWAFHDKLFDRQDKLGDALYTSMATALGLDLVQFQHDRSDPSARVALQTAIAALQALGLRGTPMALVNGKKIMGAQPYETFAAAVTAALQVRAQPGESVRDQWERFAPGEGGTAADYLLLGKAPPPQPVQPEEESEPAPADDPTVWRVPVDPQRDAIRGDGPQVQLTLVTYTDLQCPFCSRAHATVAALQQKYGSKLRVVFKHNPLPFHKHARPAHIAALAAGKQGKFWPFIDAAFEQQRDLQEATLEAIAKSLQLDMNRWQQDRQDPALSAAVEADLAGAGRCGVDGTPTMFLNGRRILGAVVLDELVSVAEQELNKAAKSQLTGQSYYEKVIASAKEATGFEDAQPAVAPADAPAVGPAKAKVEVVIYSDYQCPFCAKLADKIESFWPAWQKTGQVRVVWAPFPLSFHADAKPAAVVAIEAHKQGKYEQLHALLRGQALGGKLDAASLRTYAKQVGMDLAKLASAQEKGTHDAAIRASVERGLAIGVQGTPTVFVAGRRFAPLQGMGWEVLDQAVRNASEGKPF